jgi:hypothetical protein
MVAGPLHGTMNVFNNNDVIIRENFVIFKDIAIRLTAVETIKKTQLNNPQLWQLSMRLASGRVYYFLFQEIDNFFDRLLDAVNR